MPEQEPQVSVIIPVLNNFPDITATLDLVRDALQDDYTFETLVVISDRVEGPALRDARLYALNHDARVKPHALRSDKAAAIRWGMRHARGQVVGYIDADAGWEATPAQLRQAVGIVATGQADCAAAERDQAHWSRLRRAKTNFFAILARALFGLGIRDTQAPMKFFTRPAVELLTTHAAWRGWEFDVDLLWLLQITGHRIQPVPVTWKSNGGEAGWVTVLLLLTMAPGMIWNLAVLRLTARTRRRRIRQASASRPAA